MTYYEEFAIPPTATPDEIRQAHRRLIKILHPDLQSDAAARQLAEIQTRRINAICQTLLDPTLREEYEGNVDRKPDPAAANQRRTWATGAAVLATFVLLMLWLLSGDRAVPTPPPAMTAGATSRETPSTTRSKNRSITAANNPDHHVPAATALRAAQSNPSSTEAGGPSEPPERVPPRVDSKPEPARERPVPEPSSAPTPPDQPKLAPPEARPETNPFIGTWIYVPEPISDADTKLYRPEYIEMRIRDVKGILEGQYRARYHVPDRPLSPNVGFHFAGTPGNASVDLHWNGSNGTAGQLELKLLNVNSVQADWKVTEMAASADLVSGTAILTRVQ